MNTEQIDKAFEDLISQRAIHKKLGVESGVVRNLRYNLANGNVSMERKIELLKKSGWQEEEAKYTRKDLVSLLYFYAGTSNAARQQGPEYCIEKWEKVKK